MSLSRIECLLYAIWNVNGARDPDHPGFAARNPLCLQAFSQDGKATGKLRTFTSLHGGILAAEFDLRCKTQGKSRARLNGDKFTLEGLMLCYNLKPETAITVSKFLRRALSDPSIKPHTKLDYFSLSKRFVQIAYHIGLNSPGLHLVG